MLCSNGAISRLSYSSSPFRSPLKLARSLAPALACSRRARLAAVQPLRDSKRFEELTTFLSHMAALYKVELAEYTPTVVDLLRRSAASMTASLRRALVQACSFWLRRFPSATVTVFCRLTGADSTP